MQRHPAAESDYTGVLYLLEENRSNAILYVVTSVVDFTLPAERGREHHEQ
jgi:hypothetical protein